MKEASEISQHSKVKPCPEITNLIIFNDECLVDLGPILKDFSAFSFSSVSIISPSRPSGVESLPTAKVYSNFSDYYAIYNQLEEAAKQMSERFLFVVRTGARPSGEPLSCLSTWDEGRFKLFFDNHSKPANLLTLCDLISYPLRPAAMLLIGDDAAKLAPFKAQFLELTFWETALRLSADHFNSSVIAPVTLFRETPEQTPIASYKKHLWTVEPEKVADLRHESLEWPEHQSNLHAAVIEAHMEVFTKYASSVIPEITSQNERMKAWKQIFSAGSVPSLLPLLKLLIKASFIKLGLLRKK
jgi:hypothetical protein